MTGGGAVRRPGPGGGGGGHIIWGVTSFERPETERVEDRDMSGHTGLEVLKKQCP